MTTFYDGTKLLSLKDINGNKPEIYLCSANRSAGKTTYFNRLVVNQFKKKKIRKFMLIYRFKYELEDCADKFFKDLKGLFFPEDNMTSVKGGMGIFQELFLNDEPCGYAIPLNSADQIKKYSHFFSDVDCMVFDEFQSETNRYCTDEVKKLISVHTSVARGGGKQHRYVPVYMIGNTVSLLNPYYVEMGISSRLRSDTKFLRGDGFVLEHGFIDSASQAIKESGFARAFSNNSYISYATDNVYLNDNLSFIERPTGKSSYIATLKYGNKYFAIREFLQQGVIYCDDKADMSFPRKISITTDDHEINYLMLKRNDEFLSFLRKLFEHGCFRFKDLQCKDAVLKALSYH